jgi:hypothetical protein
MARNMNSRIVAFLRPPLIAIGFVAKLIYSVFFARAERRSANQAEAAFKREIETSLPFLFKNYNARFIPGKYLHKPFDYVSAAVDIGSFLLAFDRGRGELAIRIAAKNSGDWQKWQDIQQITAAMEDPYNVRDKAILCLEDWALLLKPSMAQLLKVFSGDQYSDTRQYLMEFKTLRGSN